MLGAVERESEEISRSAGKSFEGKAILITGGAGFLGSWLCDSMVRSGATVTCLDDLSTGSKLNLSALLRQKNFSFVKGDVSRQIPNGDFDIIVHGASIPAPDSYLSHPVETIRSNGPGMERVLERARQIDAAVLFMSTSEIYGDAKVIPTPESYSGAVDPTVARACYYESKRYGESLCMAYARQYSLDVRIARLFNSYGPRLDAGSGYSRVISRFIVQALHGTDITIHGDGKQTRSFCYVSDTILGLTMMMRKGAKGEVINIGGEQEITILDLARLTKRVTGSKSRPSHLAPRKDDPRRRRPDISKARKLLGWSPRVGLEEGLARTVDWFRLQSNL